MTEFGTLHLKSILRVRAGLLAVGCAATFGLGLFFGNPFYLLIAAALACSLGIAFLLRVWRPAWSPARLFRLFLILDTLLIALTVLSAGGISSGLAALYTLPPFLALLVLGRREALRFALWSVILFILQVLLDLSGIRVYDNTPPLAYALEQGLLVVVLLALMLILAAPLIGMTRQLQQDKRVAETRRAQAEQAETRWTLINNVALRVQESVTPDQVFATVGDELERSGLHCVVWEWNKPAVSMRMAYVSLPAQDLRQSLEFFQIDLGKFDIALARTMGLAEAVMRRTPVLLNDSFKVMSRAFPNVPTALLRRTLTQFQMDTMVFAPMRHGDQVNGVLMIFSAALTEADLAPLMALASQTASALDKARLLSEQRKRAAQLEIVNGLAARVNTAGELLEDLRTIVEQIRRKFGYHNVGVFEIEPERRRIVLLAGAGNLVEQTGAAYTQALDAGILGLVARTGEIYLARDTQVDANHLSLVGEADPVRSELTIPFQHGAATLWLFDVQSAQPDAFDANDVTALSILAEQIGSALVKARALAAEQKRAAHLAWVSQVTALATAFAEPEAIMRQMVELIQLRFGYHHVCFSRYDAARQEIELVAVAGSHAAHYPIGERSSAAKGLIGLAARTGQTVRSGNVRQDARARWDQEDFANANSELCVPFQTARAVLGVLDLESAAYDAFDANDIGAMETLASQMAVALERAYSLQTERRRSAQLAVVNQIASRVTRLVSVQELLRDAANLIRSQFGYFNVAVFENEPHAGGVRLVANAGALGQLTKPFAITLSQGIVFHVGKTGATYLCRDTAGDATYHSPFSTGRTDPVKSEIAVPLRRGANVIGVLDIQSEQRDSFSETDVTVLEILADQLATAMENARLFESEARRAAQLDAVRVLTLQVTAERDLDTLLHSILFSAMELVHADAASLDLVDKAQNDLVVIISHNLPEDYTGRRMRLGEGLAGAAAARREMIIVADYAQWEGHIKEFPTADFASMLAIPLQWQNQLLGVVALHRRRGRASFTEQESHLAGLFAAQAAIALENADLVEALQTRLRAQRALAETSARFLGLTEPQTILDEITRGALAVLNGTTALLFTTADDAAKLALASQAGETARTLNEIPPAFHNVLASTLAAQNSSFWHHDAEDLSQRRPGAMSEFQAGIVTPLRRGERALGVIAVARRAGPPFDLADAQTLDLLANSGANALERAEAFHQERQRVNELQLLFESFRATAATLDPDEVLRRLLEQLVSSLDLTSGAFVRIQRARQQLIQTHVYFAPSASAEERHGDGAVWDFARVAELEDWMAQQPFAAIQADDPILPDAACAYMQVNQLFTILLTALSAAEGVIGYIVLNESRAPRRWESNQILFVQTMASQASVAWANAELYQAEQTRTRELQALYRAGRALNQSLDLQTICENSVDALRDILGYAHVSIYFATEQALELQVARGYGERHLPRRIPLTQGVMARAVRTRETIYLPDVSADPDFLMALRDTQSEIAVPLLTNERVAGVLNVETAPDETQTFERQTLTEEDVRLLNTFANQLVVAIENARLFQETQRHLKQVRTLHTASQVLNSELEWDAALGRVAWQFLGALNVDHCALFEWQREDESLTVLAHKDAEAQALRSPRREFPARAWFADKVLRDAQIISLRQDAADPEPAQSYLSARGWQAALLVPLISKSQVVGLVELADRRQPRLFSAEEMELGKSLALQAAIAIENAKLYRDAQRRLHETETLYRYTRELGGTFDIETLGARALDAVGRLTDFDFGEVCLVREADRALVPLVFHGSLERAAESYVIPGGVGIMGWVVEHGRAARVDDVTRDPRYVAFSEHIMSEICLPLRVGVRTIGVLNLEAKAPNAFDARSEQLLTVFAQQLAIAIENARLYEQTKRDAELKAALLRELSHRVKNNLAAITSLLYMALDEPEEMRAQILSETLGRVQSMSAAHTLLARSTDGLVDLLDVGAQVLQDTVRNLAPPGAHVQVETEGDHVLIAMRQLTTLALVLNELATNVLRHGWDAQALNPLLIRFAVTRSSDQVAFSLQDNGKGLAADFDLATRAGLGLSLVQSLVEKDLQGSFTLGRDGSWTNAQVKFQAMEQAL